MVDLLMSRMGGVAGDLIWGFQDRHQSEIVLLGSVCGRFEWRAKVDANKTLAGISPVMTSVVWRKALPGT